MVGCISFSISICHSCKIAQCDSTGNATQLCKWIPNVTWASTGGGVGDDCAGWVAATKEPEPLISAHLSHHSGLSLEGRKGRAKDRYREKIKVKCFCTYLSLLLSNTFMIMSFPFTTYLTHITTRLITSLYFFSVLIMWLDLVLLNGDLCHIL